MDSASYLAYILHKLSATHDITRNYILEGQSDGEQEGPFPAYASYSSTSEKYVLTRKANLWTAKEYEHILFWAGADSRDETKNEGDRGRFCVSFCPRGGDTELSPVSLFVLGGDTESSPVSLFVLGGDTEPSPVSCAGKSIEFYIKSFIFR